MEVGGLYRSVALRLDVGREFHSHMGNHFPLGQYQNDGETRKERSILLGSLGIFYEVYQQHRRSFQQARSKNSNHPSMSYSSGVLAFYLTIPVFPCLSGGFDMAVLALFSVCYLKSIH